jgi:ABC-type dipeptide/oligopeptide/nickel transport system permease component
MTRIILRRLVLFPFAVLMVHFLGFAYAHLIRPLRAFRNPFLATSTQPEPLLPTYLGYIRTALEGNLGTMSNPWGPGTLQIQDGILQASLASLGLLAIALALSVLVGMALGWSSAIAEPPSIARWLSTVSTVGMAMPTFFVGSLFFAFWFLYVLWGGPGTLPLPLGGFGWDSHVIVPTLVLMARPAVQLAQVTGGLLAEEFGKQYVTAARSTGYTWRQIRRRNAMRNILAAVILTIASSVRLLVGELIVVEWLFNWPGLGSLLAQTLIPGGFASSRTAIEHPLYLDPPVVASVLAILQLCSCSPIWSPQCWQNPLIPG